MNQKLHLSVELELTKPRLRKGRRPVVEERALALAEAVVAHVLPSLANEAGVEKDRLAGALLAELGYDVGRSNPPAAAMDMLAVATERLRDAIAGRGPSRRFAGRTRYNSRSPRSRVRPGAGASRPPRHSPVAVAGARSGRPRRG